MRLALDTNRYTDLARNVPEVVAWVEEADEIFLPFVVLAELRGGFAAGNRARKNEEALRVFLQKPNVVSLYADEDTTIHYATLWNYLRRRGTPIPSNDLWIASLVLQHRLTLYARDGHFKHLPQIAVI
jgi:tRNA(fMet)-specific endonuclease VapC